METKPNDSAFSRPYSRDEHSGDRPESHWAFDGLTKREHFAWLAMQSFCYDKETKAFDEPTDKFYQMAAIIIR